MVFTAGTVPGEGRGHSCPRPYRSGGDRLVARARLAARTVAASAAAVAARAETDEPGDHEHGKQDDSSHQDGGEEGKEHESAERSYEHVGSRAIVVVPRVHGVSFGLHRRQG
jgi:hypothetical protein